MTSHQIADTRPPPKDLSHLFSRTAKARQASSIKRFYKYFQIPGIAQLAGGLPNSFYFPFDTLEAKIARPNRWHPTPNKPIDPPPPERALAALAIKHDNVKSKDGGPLGHVEDSLRVPHTSSQANPLKRIDLATALQYGQAQGYPPLYYFIRQFTQDHLHPNCPYQGGPEVILTCGNTDGWSKVLSAFVNDWSEEKDWVRDREGLLCEEFSYGNALQGAKPKGMNIVPVGIDDEGMRAFGPGGLKDVLENWDYKRGKLPHLMYTVTMGQNPTSGVLSLQRRREIYALCSKYDIIIVEDDPYWYLQFPTATAMNTTTTSHAGNSSFNPDVAMFANAEPRPDGWKSSGYPFLDALVPSSINIDPDGRVIRLDTFSKTVAPGCRLGWISAQPAFIERILRVTETSTQQPSGFVQSIVAELLLGPDQSGLDKDASPKTLTKGGKGGLPSGEGWKADGWVRWVEGLRGNYERRMNTMSTILDTGRYLVKTGRRPSLSASIDADHDDADDEWSVVEKTPIYSFDWPVGGMFIWLTVHFAAHPLASTFAPARLAEALWVFWTSKPYLILIAPGSMASPTPEIAAKKGYKHFRICFAAIDEEDLAAASQRLADGAGDFFRIKDRKVIDKLLEENVEEEAVGADAAGMADLARMMGPC